MYNDNAANVSTSLILRELTLCMSNCAVCCFNIILPASAGWAAHMGVSSNVRYQVLNGFEMVSTPDLYSTYWRNNVFSHLAWNGSQVSLSTTWVGSCHLLCQFTPLKDSFLAIRRLWHSIPDLNHVIGGQIGPLPTAHEADAKAPYLTTCCPPEPCIRCQISRFHLSLVWGQSMKPTRINHIEPVIVRAGLRIADIWLTVLYTFRL